MKKNIILPVNATQQRTSWKQFVLPMLKPITWLQGYYSTILEKPISIKQTFLLINAQIAFVMAVFPADAPVLLRLFCCGWLLNALWKCKCNL